MNQQLYNQFVDAASLMVVAQKVDAAIQEKWDESEGLGILLAEAKKKADNAHHSYRARTIWGIILTAVGFTYLLPALLSGGDTAAAMGFIFFISGIIGLIMIGSARRKRRKYKKQAVKEYEELEADLMPTINKNDEEVQQLKDYLRQYATENDHLISFLPSKYRNPTAIEFMMKAVENLRADNLTDVINLYEQELHFLEQKRIMNNNAEMQRLHNESMLSLMESINQNQERTNSNLQFIQAMQFINMLDD